MAIFKKLLKFPKTYKGTGNFSRLWYFLVLFKST